MPQSPRQHRYTTQVRWIGNLGPGTSGYRGYSRDHEISAGGRLPIPGSSDPEFRGDPARYNPEELLVASLSSCHMLWYLHLAADAGVVVVDYLDEASGTMDESAEGGGHFTGVALRPQIGVAPGANLALAAALHEQAHQKCFIANSVNFPVRCEPVIEERGA